MFVPHLPVYMSELKEHIIVTIITLNSDILTHTWAELLIKENILTHIWTELLIKENNFNKWWGEEVHGAHDKKNNFY